MDEHHSEDISDGIKRVAGPPLTLDQTWSKRFLPFLLVGALGVLLDIAFYLLLFCALRFAFCTLLYFLLYFFFI